MYNATLTVIQGGEFGIGLRAVGSDLVVGRLLLTKPASWGGGGLWTHSPRILHCWRLN